MLPEFEAELLAENEAKKDRNVDNLGLLYALKGVLFFLCESEELDD